MTAGRGIAHSERTPLETADRMLSGIQFWVALPRSCEEAAASFVHLEASDLPIVEDGAVSTRIIAGEAFGVRSPLNAPHPMVCLDVAMARDTSLELPTGYPERAIYVAGGIVELAGARHERGQLLVFPPRHDAKLRAVSDARLVLLGGEPMDGPRHIWWNFVSSSRDRIEQAKQDWKAGRFASVPGETEFIPLPE
jgi:hypothetical protein